MTPCFARASYTDGDNEHEVLSWPVSNLQALDHVIDGVLYHAAICQHCFAIVMFSHFVVAKAAKKDQT